MTVQTQEVLAELISYCEAQMVAAKRAQEQPRSQLEPPFDRASDVELAGMVRAFALAMGHIRKMRERVMSERYDRPPPTTLPTGGLPRRDGRGK